MKKMKVILVTVLIAIVSFGFAKTTEKQIVANQTEKSTKIMPLELAMQIPKLLTVMYEQLTTSFLIPDKPSYTVTVKFNGNIYYIYGTHRDWTRFFKLKPGNNNTIGGS